jgi:acetyltransferase
MAQAERQELGPLVVNCTWVITHKTDVAGQLNPADADAARAFRSITKFRLHGESDAAGNPNMLGVTVQPMVTMEGYELIIGSSIDPQFGPVLLFGLGGQLVEVFKDSSLSLPPLNSTLARRMMERTNIYTALQGVRGRQAVDMEALEHLLVEFSQLVAEQRWIKEIDINPLIVSPERLLALDARVLLHPAEVSEAQLPHLAIRPYPSQYMHEWTARDGTPIVIRPIRAEDEPLMVAFHSTLSDRSVYLRFMHPALLSDGKTSAAHACASRLRPRIHAGGRPHQG